MTESEVKDYSGQGGLEFFSKYKYPIMGGVVLSLAFVYLLKRFGKFRK